MWLTHLYCRSQDYSQVGTFLGRIPHSSDYNHMMQYYKLQPHLLALHVELIWGGFSMAYKPAYYKLIAKPRNMPNYTDSPPYAVNKRPFSVGF